MTPQPILKEQERGERICGAILIAVDRNRRRVQHERDLAVLANYRPENFDQEPGWLPVFRERVAAYEMGVGDE